MRAHPFRAERKMGGMLDQTDVAILTLLRQNARLSWKEIGEQVHMTGQAVATRITKLQELGILQQFTVVVDESRMGRPLLAFVTVFMKSTDHAGFARFLQGEPAVEEGHRVTGEGCYLLRVRCADQEALTQLLDRILHWGNYRVSLTLTRVK